MFCKHTIQKILKIQLGFGSQSFCGYASECIFSNKSSLRAASKIHASPVWFAYHYHVHRVAQKVSHLRIFIKFQIVSDKNHIHIQLGCIYITDHMHTVCKDGKQNYVSARLSVNNTLCRLIVLVRWHFLANEMSIWHRLKTLLSEYHVQYRSIWCLGLTLSHLFSCRSENDNEKYKTSYTVYCCISKEQYSIQKHQQVLRANWRKLLTDSTNLRTPNVVAICGQHWRDVLQSRSL